MEHIQNNKLNLKNDIIFKAFFSKKGNEEFLIDFLNAILKIDIKHIEIKQEVSLEKLCKEEKGGRLDIQAYINDGTVVDIEMQVNDENNIQQRTKFYAASEVKTEAIKSGKSYDRIKDVILINIMDFNIFECEDYISDTIIVLNKHRNIEAIEGLKWYFIELPKFRKAHPNMNEKINQWLAFIDDYDGGLIKMAEEKNKTIQKSKVEMNTLNGDEEVKRLAFLREKWELDRNSAISYAEKKRYRKTGKLNGRIERRKIWDTKTEKMSGIKETQINVAKKMLMKGMSIKEIIELTDLTVEEIKNLE